MVEQINTAQLILIFVLISAITSTALVVQNYFLLKKLSTGTKNKKKRFSMRMEDLKYIMEYMRKISVDNELNKDVEINEGEKTAIALKRDEHTYSLFQFIAYEIQNMLYKKNMDYGDDNLIQDGMTGIIVRLSDKISRLRNLTKEENTVIHFESIEDTLKDIQGYQINQIRLIKEQKI